MTNDEAIKWLEAIRKKYIHGGDEGFDIKRNEAVDLAIAALERDRWISVEERLPERNVDVLVSAKGKINGFIGETVTAISERYIFRLMPHLHGKETWRSPWDYFLADYDITHWRPLPEPPKEKT